MRGFAVDGDTQYDAIHSEHDQSNRHVFEVSGSLASARKFRMISDPLHFFKRVRSRLTKPTPMVLRLAEDSTELDLDILIDVLGADVPSIVFSDAQITTMHDSLPMVSFRSQHLMTLITLLDKGLKRATGHTKISASFGYLLHWVLLHEAISHENTPTHIRLAWLKVTYFILIAIQQTSKQFGFGKGVREHGRTTSANVKRCLVDRKLVGHGRNTIAAIISEIEQLDPGKLLSLQRLSKGPREIV
jgi:hypothetical protein